MSAHGPFRSAEALAGTPNPLARHYTRFRVADRLLLTGHSHQAWPDRAFDGQRRAWWDAAEWVDEKWEEAFVRADRVRRGFARLLGDPGGHFALAPNTHELVVRFLSGLPLRDRPRLVTTDGEFHSIRRQLDRLAEEGLEVVKVPSRPADAVADRLAQAADDRTAAVLVSCVLFRDARIVAGLGRTMEACRRVGAELLVDAYHALNVVPFELAAEGLEDAFVTGGGYKYCQLGEGNCFLRIPEACRMRPAITGWFAEFGAVVADGGAGAGSGSRRAGGAEASGGARGDTPAGRVPYADGSARFAGSTYDPTSHYRAAEVFEFFEELRLTPELLRQVSQRQVKLLARRFDALDLDPSAVRRDRSVPVEAIGGFLALESPWAGELQRILRERGVMVDHREDVLRLGPAPYLSDEQLEDAIEALGEAARQLAVPPAGP